MKKTSAHNLFLMECILALLFFSLAAAVCAQLFGKSYALEQQTRDLNRSTLLAQSAAEAFRSCGGDLEETATLLGTSLEEDSLSVRYEEDGTPSPGQGVYLLLLTRREEEGVAYGQVTVSREGTTTASLEAAVALPVREGGTAP